MQGHRLHISNGLWKCFTFLRFHTFSDFPTGSVFTIISQSEHIIHSGSEQMWAVWIVTNTTQKQPLQRAIPPTHCHFYQWSIYGREKCLYYFPKCVWILQFVAIGQSPPHRRVSVFWLAITSPSAAQSCSVMPDNVSCLAGTFDWFIAWWSWNKWPHATVFLYLFVLYPPPPPSPSFPLALPPSLPPSLPPYLFLPQTPFIAHNESLTRVIRGFMYNCKGVNCVTVGRKPLASFQIYPHKGQCSRMAHGCTECPQNGKLTKWTHGRTLIGEVQFSSLNLRSVLLRNCVCSKAIHNAWQQKRDFKSLSFSSMCLKDQLGLSVTIR